MSYQHFIWLYRYLWIAPHMLLLAVAVVMVRKKTYKDFPVFFSYLLFEFLQFCVLLTTLYVKVSPALYYKIDVYGRAGDIALHFGILHELFVAPVGEHLRMHRDMARILNWIMIVLAALASMFIGVSYYKILNPSYFWAYVILGTLNAAQCGLIVVLFLWHRILGLRMTPFVFGIAVGLGLVVSLEPLMVALKTLVPVSIGQITDIVSMAAYHITVLVWLYYAQMREKVTADANLALPKLIEQAADMGRIAHL